MKIQSLIQEFFISFPSMLSKHIGRGVSKHLKQNFFLNSGCWKRQGTFKPSFFIYWKYLNACIWFFSPWGQLQRMSLKNFCVYKRLVVPHVRSWHMWLTPCHADSNDRFGPLLYKRNRNSLKEIWTSPPYWSRREIQAIAIEDGLSRKSERTA